MSPRAPRNVLLGLVAGAGLLGAACSRTFVVVPRPAGGYTRVDTLRGISDGRDVRVIFRFDTTYRVDTVTFTRTDTLWRGTRTIVRVDTVRVRDTIRVPALPPRRDTTAAQVNPRTVTDRAQQVPRVDTVRITRVDTLVRRDTIRIPVGGGRVDTVRVTRVDTLRIARVDTVRLTRVDTLRIARIDTLRLTRVDTLRVGGGPRFLFVPPGHYPPAGQCRVWVPNTPPGRQARAAPCDQLGNIPAGAFILFGGTAWDADWDWVRESQRGDLPPEIVVISRNRGRP